MVEGEGFEPLSACAHTGFQDRWLQPLGHPSDANLTRRRPPAVQPNIRGSSTGACGSRKDNRGEPILHALEA